MMRRRELARKHGWFQCRQFENEANADMHSRTTAPRSSRAFESDRLDYWVTGCGTGGTLKGVARVLKAQRPETAIVVCEPDNRRRSAAASPARGGDGTPARSHPSARPHLMQGWTPDFIPKLTGDAIDLKLIDEIVPSTAPMPALRARAGDRRRHLHRNIRRRDTGWRIADRREGAGGANIVCMLPDTGERYLSTPLFDGVAAT
jgi:cysteine synthase A